jgi:hypothetical protein
MAHHLRGPWKTSTDRNVFDSGFRAGFLSTTRTGCMGTAGPVSVIASHNHCK